MIGIELRHGEDINRAIKRFSNMCARSGLLADMRRGRYEKPSSIKKQKKNTAAHEKRKLLKKLNQKLY